jgi:non-specific serine/threonine protein kinase
VPHNVPAALSSLVGRTREVAEIGRVLASSRLVTLIGPGGAGKTRLAREVAAATVGAGAHPGGVWWVELAPVGAGADVAATVAAVLGVSPPPGRPVVEALAAALGGAAGAPRRLLLVLDNCEHVIDDVAALAEQLLRAAPGLTVLATSREALAIEGEVARPVPPLARPPVGAGAPSAPVDAYEAVQLFVERARAASPGFALTEANAPAVAAICARLDGLPLALELAAAVLPALGVEALAARLDDALALLARGRRTALPRHRTLRAVLDWSHELLTARSACCSGGSRCSAGRSPSTRSRRCARRAGGTPNARPPHGAAPDAAPDAGTDVVRDVVRALGRLVEHSLVEVREDAGETRYRLLETVRQYGAALLDGTPDARATRARHARWVADVAARAEPALFSPARGRTVERLQREVDEIRAALAWAAQRVDGRPVGEPMTGRAHRRRARLVLVLGRAVGRGARPPRRDHRRRRRRGGRRRRPPARRPVALGSFFYPYTGLHYFAGDADGILRHTARELALWDTVDAAAAADPASVTPAQRLAAARGRSLCHQLRGLAHAMRGERGPAAPAVTRSIAVAEAGGDPWLAAVMTMRRALVHLMCGDHADADADYRAAIPKLRALGEWWFLSLTYEGMAARALATGDLVTAVHDGRLSMRALHAERDEWFASRALDILGAVLAASDARRPDDAHVATAARLLGAAAALRRRRGTLIIGPDRERQEAATAAVRARLGEAAFAAAAAAGEAMTLDDAYAFVDDDAHFAGVAGAPGAPAAPGGVPARPAPAEAEDDDAARPAPEARPRTLRLDELGPFGMAADGAPAAADALPVGRRASCCSSSSSTSSRRRSRWRSRSGPTRRRRACATPST